MSVNNPIVPSGDSSNVIVVRKGAKSYSGSKVFEDLNLTVPKGVIYGLLGASGCGKTTLLECLVGRKVLDRGEITVFNRTVFQGVPDLRIGYMPQGTGLYNDLTIEETLLLFGRLIGIEENKIRERIRDAIELLVLPEINRLFGSLSGGEQRRVSLAVAQLHEPALLILDEPTVGVDCVLKELIWDNFRCLADGGKVTMLLTTHSMEEAMQTHVVGIMRSGRLIAEASPQDLLRAHQKQSLDEVFLKLSLHQDDHKITDKVTTDLYPKRKRKHTWRLSGVHLKTLLWKNLIWFRNNLPSLSFILILPAMIVTLVSFTLGHEPEHFSIAVVNRDTGECQKNATLLCESNTISCTFIQHLEARKLQMVHYDIDYDAIRSVQTGKTYAAIFFKRNYSRALRERVYAWKRVSDNAIEGSTIDVFRDLTNSHIAIYIHEVLYKTYQKVVEDFNVACGLPVNYMRIPIVWNSTYNPLSFTTFFVSGIILAVIFFIGYIITASALGVDLNDANVDRLMVIGVNIMELIVANAILFSAMIVLQTLLIMVIAFVVFKLTVDGSALLVAMLVTFMGVSGVSYGLLLACISKSERDITFLSTGTLLFFVITGGIIWPVQGMHWILRPFVVYFPLTQPIIGLRSILYRGANLWNYDVCMGFTSIILWMLIFLLCTVILAKLKYTH